MKFALLIGGYALLAVATADLATGKSSTPILPAVVGNMLTQEIDIAFLLVGGGIVWYGHSKR